MNNKPVAWMDGINTFVLDKDYKHLPKSFQNGMIPLYTHSVKELTDEEIDNLIADVAEKPTDEDLYDFAKSILRKAQEK